MKNIIYLTKDMRPAEYTKPTKFNVIICDNGRFRSYDVIPYLLNEYKYKKLDIKDKRELQEFILDQARYQWWARCQYEIVLQDWPVDKNQLKIDVYQQVCMNIDIITDILYNEIHIQQN